MTYTPGIHLIASLRTTAPELLTGYAPFREIVEELITFHDLQKLGEVYHDFSPGGFTAVVCLSESHLSIHTWPEHALINLDIYLSNHKRNNDGTVQAIFETLVDYFNADITHQQTICR